MSTRPAFTFDRAPTKRTHPQGELGSSSPGEHIARSAHDGRRGAVVQARPTGPYFAIRWLAYERSLGAERCYLRDVGRGELHAAYVGRWIDYGAPVAHAQPFTTRAAAVAWAELHRGGLPGGWPAYLAIDEVGGSKLGGER